MKFKTLNSYRLVQTGLVVAALATVLLVVCIYYFDFNLLKQEASLFEESHDITCQQDQTQEAGSSCSADQLKLAPPTSAAPLENVPDVFSPTRVPKAK
jgi:hypothetical protein